MQTATLNKMFEVSLLVRHNRDTRQDNRERHFGWWSLVAHVDYERKLAVRVDVVQLDQGTMIGCFLVHLTRPSNGSVVSVVNTWSCRS